MILKKRKLNKELLMTIIALAWPTMLQEAMQTAVQYIDTAMVGVLGTQATAAVGATTTVSWLVFSTTAAFGIGFLSYIARCFGSGNHKDASRASGQAVLVTLVLGIAMTALLLGISKQVPAWMQVDPDIRDLAARYFFVLYAPMLPRTALSIFGMVLRGAGDTKTPMKIGAAVNILNIILNFFLIYPSRSVWGISVFGAGLGVVGAALASAISFTIGGISITVMLWRHPMISPRGSRIRPDMEILVPCMQVALPNMLQRFGTSLGYVVFASMVNSLGEMSTAAHTIANTVESAFYIPGYGMQTAAATLVGNAYGARDKTRMKDISELLLPIEVVLMVLSGATLFIFAPQLMGIFSDSGSVISLGTTVLRMVAVTEPFYGVSIIVEGMMQGVGRTKAPFIYNIIGMWGIRIVGTYICTQLLSLGLVSAWACMIGHNLLLFVLFCYSFYSGKWNPLHQ